MPGRRRAALNSSVGVRDAAEEGRLTSSDPVCFEQGVRPGEVCGGIEVVIFSASSKCSMQSGWQTGNNGRLEFDAAVQ